MAEDIKIALVDDHALFRTGLAGLLKTGHGCLVVAQCSNGAEMLAQMAGGLEVDVVLMDIDMPVMDGFRLAELLAVRHPHVKAVAISMHGDEEYYFRMVALGVKGFMLKDSTFDEVCTAITTVAGGGTYFSQALLTALVGARHPTPCSPREQLSERELEILALICKGLSNQEIGEKLFISKRTVDKHRANILEKTETKNTANLVMYAIKNSLVKL